MIVATGTNRFSTNWVNRGFSWEGLIDYMRKNIVQTPETLDEYEGLDKDTRINVKDVGGILAGKLVDGETQRKEDNMDTAEILVLDADKNVPQDFIQRVDTLGWSYITYTTRSHTTEKPRWRLILPLSRAVTAEEYKPMACRIVEDLGVEICGCSFRLNQLMYFGSYSKNGNPPLFRSRSGKVVDVEDALTRPYNPELFEGRITMGKKGKLGDPRLLSGIVGAFCRCYSITETITKFLPDVYEATSDPYRWGKIGGTSAGLVIYDNDSWCYSFHSEHDPAAEGGHEHNSFNLVKVHKWGNDFVACCKWIRQSLPNVVAEDAKAAFQHVEEVVQKETKKRGDWVKAFERGDAAEVLPSPLNALLALTHDEALSGVAYNDLKETIAVTTKLPWRPVMDGQWHDQDDRQLDLYLTKEYNQFKVRDIDNAFTSAYMGRRFNPLQDRLNSLPVWDSINRVETLFCDLFGAENTPINRIMTRKWLAAAYQRAFNPGIKFDSMIVLSGPTNIQKSRSIKTLALGFSTDTVSVADMEDGKKASEKVVGIWIAELGELVGMKKADKEALKLYLSTECDRYRAAYGRYVIDRPRLTCFIGTDNTGLVLTDATGNRRFWPIECVDFKKELTEAEALQVWAEVKAKFSTENLYLSREEETIANGIRENFFDVNPWEITIKEWLVEDAKSGIEAATVKNIWVECLHKTFGDITMKDKTVISDIMLRLTGHKAHNVRTGKREENKSVYGWSTGEVVKSW
jgi:predicted P-loop ATPase